MLYEYGFTIKPNEKAVLVEITRSYDDDVFVKLDGEIKIIYRDILQRKLLKFLKKYIDDLKNRNIVFDFQRAALCRKLDNIYGTEFDWNVNLWNPNSI